MDEYKLNVSEDGDALTGVSRGNHNDWENVLNGVSMGRLQRIALDQRRAWALALNARLSADSSMLRALPVDIIDLVRQSRQPLDSIMLSFADAYNARYTHAFTA